MFVVIAKQKVHPEKIEEFKANVAAMAPKTRQCPGCLHYELLQSKEEPSVFLFHEIWDNETDFDAHFETDFTKEFSASLESIADGEVEPYICSVVV